MIDFTLISIFEIIVNLGYSSTDRSGSGNPITTSVVSNKIYSFQFVALLQIDTLLDSICKDSGISLDEGVASINKLSETQDIKDVFHVSIE